GGNIVFKPFSDASCTVVAFTSAAVPVHGPGNYGPVSFTPTVAGTYKWIAAYSGDNSNKPATGTCGDAGETSTVTPNITIKVDKTNDANGDCIFSASETAAT